MTRPIILTAVLGAQDFAWAQALRTAHFPAERNQVPAHVTLFHHLPPSVEAELAQRMARLCAEPAPEARLADVMALGRGVAYRIDCPGLLALRADLAEAFAPLLVPQDRGEPRLHITVQNKVDPAVARVLADRLRAEFRPRPLLIAGLKSWRYLGGPWEAIKEVRFRG